jgi:Tfp pilus assembly protein PilN
MLYFNIRVSASTLRIAVFRGERLIHEAEMVRSSESFADGLDQLMSKAPRARLTTPRVFVALDGSDVVVKRIVGLPTAVGREDVFAIVRQQSTRFFIHEPTPPENIVVDMAQDGVVAALYSVDAVAATTRACAASNVKLVGIIPYSETEKLAGPWRTKPHSLMWMPRRNPRAREGARWTIAFLAIFLALMFAVSSRGIQATLRGRTARATLASLQSRAAWMDSLDEEARRLNERHRETARFLSGRRYVTELLGSLATTLPESTSIVSLEADSVGGVMTLLSVDVGETTTSLLETAFFKDVSLEGTVRTETMNSSRLERATLRFATRWSAARRAVRK